MTTAERRRVVTHVQAAVGISERRAVRFTGFPRSTIRYQSVREPQAALTARIHELAADRSACARACGSTTPVRGRRLKWKEDGTGFVDRGRKKKLLGVQDEDARFTLRRRLTDDPAPGDTWDVPAGSGRPRTR